MKFLNSLSFALFLIFSIFKLCSALTQTDYLITDLESTDSSGFTNEANSWAYKYQSCPSCIFSMPSGSECSEIVYGGPEAPSGTAQVSFQRSYSISGAPWSRFGVEVEVWAFATAELPGPGTLNMLSTKLTSSGGYTGSGYTLIGSCSTNYQSTSGSQIKFIYKYLARTVISSTSPVSTIDFLTLKTGAAPAAVDSLGFRNVKIYNMGSSSATSGPNFPCADSRFWDGTGCQACLSTCSSCTGPNLGQCTVCKYSAYNYGNGNCLGTLCNGAYQLVTGSKNCTKTCSTGFYWARNQSCIESCEGPLVGSLDTLGIIPVCSSPCTDATKFVYSDGSCWPTCDPRLDEDTSQPTLKLCLNPCETSSMFLYPDGSCVNACPTSLSEKTENNVKYCESPCPSTAKYMSPDGSCKSDCDLPLIEKTENGILSCVSPCSDLTDYLYPDGSCEKTCLFSEKTENQIKFCKSPCPSTAIFLNPDGSCTAVCDPSLTSSTTQGIRTCISHCLEYVLPDGSCGECPAPFPKRIENSMKYCENPCFGTQTFLYEDGTCQKSCASPSTPKDYPSIGKTCKFPCANVNYYYNNRNGKCTKTCEYTSKPIDSPLPKICYSTLTEEEVEKVREIGDAADGANTATSTGAMIWSFISSGDSTSAMLGPLAKMLQYIKFMDIMFPEKVLILMDAQSKNSEGFSAKMMKGALEKFPSHELPRKFKVYQASSSFFVNFWPALFNLSVILFVTALAVFGAAKTKGHPKINGIFKSMVEILKWNVFLITFSGSVGDIILFTALEFQTMQFDNVAAVFSFLLCLGINTLAVLVVIQIIDVNSAIRNSKKKVQDEEEHKKKIEQQWNSYKALFECYKDYSFYQQIFLFVFLVRLALFNAIIGYFYNYPLFQASTAVASNILMLAYLLTKKPMKKLVNLIQQIVLEFVLLPFNVCVLALAIMDYHEIEDLDRRKSIGDVIVYINLIAPILSSALLAAKAIVMGVDFYKTWKLAKQNKLKKLASVEKGFRLDDALSSSKNFVVDHTQILDITDQSMISIENSLGNQRPGEPLRSNFMLNHENHQSLIPMTTNLNDFQQIQNHRRKINKRRYLSEFENRPLKIKFGN